MKKGYLKDNDPGWSVHRAGEGRIEDEGGRSQLEGGFVKCKAHDGNPPAPVQLFLQLVQPVPQFTFLAATYGRHRSADGGGVGGDGASRQLLVLTTASVPPKAEDVRHPRKRSCHDGREKGLIICSSSRPLYCPHFHTSMGGTFGWGVNGRWWSVINSCSAISRFVVCHWVGCTSFCTG